MTDKAHGRKAGEPQRFIRHHHRRKSAVEYIVNENGCWIWQRGAFHLGYGTGGGGRGLAHRIIYERHKGAIPPGLVLDHLCRVKLCVNPDHLEPVTQRENIQRGRQVKLNPAAVIAIRRAVNNEGRRIAEVAAQYGVAWHTVEAVIIGRSWPNVVEP